MKKCYIFLSIIIVMIFALPATGSMRPVDESWKTVQSTKSFDEGTRVEYSLTLLANPEEGGEVIGSGMYEVGEVIYIQAIENDGYDFYDWTMDGEHYAWVQNFTFTMPEEDVELTANFQVIYELILQVSPEGAGTVSGAGEYPENANVAISANGVIGYNFVKWTDENGVLISSFPELTYNMPAYDVMLIANFEEAETVIIEEFPWEENFETATFPPSGWAKINVLGSVQWVRQNAPGGGHCAYHMYGNFLEDDWLISPAIVISEDGEYLLSFRNYNYYSSYYPGYGANSVLVSNGSPDPADEEYQLIWSPDTVVEEWEETTLDLTGYAGDTLYIAFRYYAEYTHNWYVDDVKIKGVPQVSVYPDVISEVLEPGSIDTLALEIQNSGSGALEYAAIVQVPVNRASEKSTFAGKRKSKKSFPEFTYNKTPEGLQSSHNPKNPVLHYDGENTGSVGLQNGGELIVAAMFPADLTIPYNQYLVKSLDVFLMSGAIETRIMVWGSGTPTEPGPLLYEQPFEPVEFSWNNVPLSTPVFITGEDIWIGYSVSHDATYTPVGMDAGPAADGGDWIYFNNEWTRMSDVSSFDANFNIRANLILGDYWLGISPDTGTIAAGTSQIMNVVIDAENLAVGSYGSNIVINTNDPLNAVTNIPVTVDVLVGLVDDQREIVSIYPLPAENMVNISATGKIILVEIFSTTGQIIQQINGNGQRSVRIKTGQLQPGLYPVRVLCDNGIVLARKIMIR
ncbi:MAG: choice-of-anchor J domain-containing protein [Bacteroidales bacterium]|nr:choice-of-anchor J domain-containing protein [Bacteroidales bacterium]